ncbi:MAG: hypothetical protein HYU66_18530, partial [Armatimonadetes bacterium]|nr:hypothetical protein [Armatimonadota bacterium]
GNFPPVTVFGDAGYDGPADFFKPSAVQLERGYLDDLLSAVGGDPVVLGYTLFGENDQIPGEAWVNGTAEFVKQHAKGLLVFEQGGGLQNHGELKPGDWDRFFPATDGGIGYRNYYSDGTPTDAYANVNARFYAQHGPSFLAEESSDGPGWYHDRITWLAPDFVTQFRDNLWASLCAPQAASLFWSVILIDSERRLPTQIAERMDWRGFRRAPGQLAVVCPAGSAKVLPVLAAIDDACCRAGVTYDIVPPGTDLAGYAGSMVAGGPAELPAAVLDKALLSLCEGNAATILADAAGKQLLAYVRNVVEHRLGPGYGEGVKELHRQRTASREVTLDIRALPDAAELTVWDVDTGEVVKQGRLGANRRLALGNSTHDFALLARAR